jgi:cytochrome c
MPLSLSQRPDKGYHQSWGDGGRSFSYNVDMRLFIITALTCFLAWPPTASAEGVAARGQRIAERNCASCHAVSRTGTSPSEKAPAFRTLAQRYKLQDLEEALAEGIMVGHEAPEMPLFEFTSRQIADFMAYLRSIQVKSPLRP